MWLSPQPPLPVSAGSIHCVSQQGWSLSSNKPLSHRLMPADDKSPPPERVEPTVCLIKPKGRDRAGHTARERGRERQIEEGKNSSFHLSSSQAAIGLQDMTARLDFLPSLLIFLPLSLLSTFILYFYFLLVMRKCPLSLSLPTSSSHSDPSIHEHDHKFTSVKTA